MTTGIYQLNFNNRAFYVGKSIDIETRWKQHTDKFLKGTAASQMQYAYNQVGLPAFGIYAECHKDYLDILEGYYINMQVNHNRQTCLNTSIPKLDPNLDYDWLLSHHEVMQHSATDLIRSYENVTRDEAKLREEYETLQHSYNKAFMIHKAAADLKYGKDENAELVKQYHDRLRHAQEKVSKLLNRGLFDRIFNHQ